MTSGRYSEVVVTSGLTVYKLFVKLRFMPCYLQIVLRRELFVADFANDLHGQTLSIRDPLVGVLVMLEAEVLLQLGHAGELGRAVFALKRLVLFEVKGSFSSYVIICFNCFDSLLTLCYASMDSK